jgi:hypothetical protein
MNIPTHTIIAMIIILVVIFFVGWALGAHRASKRVIKAVEAQLEFHGATTITQLINKLHNQYRDELDRLIELIEHINTVNAVVYGNQPPTNPDFGTWEFMDVDTLRIRLRGVQIRYFTLRGSAAVEWHDGGGWQHVDFNLRAALPAHLIAKDLSELFRKKRMSHVTPLSA